MNGVDIFQIVRIKDLNNYKQWIKSNPDLNVENESKENLLQIAIGYKNQEVALDLIARGVKLDHTNSAGKTALHYAVEHGDVQVVKEILNRDVDVNVVDEHGNNPLWTAVFNARGNHEIVELLLCKGADPSNKNKYKKCAMDFAEQIKDEDLINLIRKHV